MKTLRYPEEGDTLTITRIGMSQPADWLCVGWFKGKSHCHFHVGLFDPADDDLDGDDGPMPLLYKEIFKLKVIKAWEERPKGTKSVTVKF